MSALLLEAKSAKRLLREEGPRALFRKYGWKLVMGLIAYYLIRDITLYVILPLLVLSRFR